MRQFKGQYPTVLKSCYGQSTISVKLLKTMVRSREGDSTFPHLERLVGVEVEREARVREEEVQAAEGQQVVAARLARKGLDRPWEGHGVEQGHLVYAVDEHGHRLVPVRGDRGTKFVMRLSISRTAARPSMLA